MSQTADCEDIWFHLDLFTDLLHRDLPECLSEGHRTYPGGPPQPRTTKLFNGAARAPLNLLLFGGPRIGGRTARTTTPKWAILDSHWPHSFGVRWWCQKR